MNEVFDKTRQLADALMASEEYIQMKAAEDKAAQNPEAAELMSRYLEHKSALEGSLSSGSPDPEAIAAHKNAMDEIQARFREIDDIAAMQSARQSFDNLIDQVNQVLQFIITGRMDSDENCTGSCATCPGCHG